MKKLDAPLKKSKRKFDLDRFMSDRNFRVAVCKRSVGMFNAYYLSHLFTHKTANLHKYMYRNMNELLDGDLNLLAEITFRDSAKTSITKGAVLQVICYRKKRNIVWVGFEQDKSEENILAVRNELESNAKIIRDFGQLWFPDPNETSKEAKNKRRKNFRSENGVNVTATSVAKTVRGLVRQYGRPDFVVADDIENEKTKASVLKTRTVIHFLGEMETSLAIGASILVLGNYITSTGSVQYVIDKIKRNEDDSHLHFVPLEVNGVIQWDKFVRTQKEALKINKAVLKAYKGDKAQAELHYVVSVEKLKSKYGTELFNQEYMLIPQENIGTVVKRDWWQFWDRNRMHKDDEGNYWYRFGDDEEAIKATHVVIAVDPAVSKSESSDERAMVAAARFDRMVKLGDDTEESEERYLVLACRAGRWGMDEFANQLMKLRDDVNAHEIGVESNGVQEVFRDIFDRKRISTSVLDPDGDKMRRMNRNVGDIEFGRVLVPNDKSCMDLVDEIVAFTGEDGKPDNKVDAFNYAIQMLKEMSGQFIAVEI